MYKKVLSDKDIDAFLVSDRQNIRYISGFSGEGVLYISENRSVIITDSRYTEAASLESSFEVIEQNTSKKRNLILAELAGADKAKRIGFEDKYITYETYKKLESEIGCVGEWVPLGDALNDLRMVKTPGELELMRRASEIADEAFTGLLSQIRQGMTEKEGAAELEYRMRRLGADRPSFDTIFAAGKHSSMPHAVPTDYKLHPGDFITIDFGCRYKGYCSDTTRTVALGEPSKRQKEIYGIVLKAHMAALSTVREGVAGGDVDRAAREVIAEAGYGKYFGHSTGHAVGLYVHEEPRFAPNVKTIYRAGMTGTIEPGIYLPGEFGVRIEDMIAVTKDGCESFTKLDKNLVVL